MALTKVTGQVIKNTTDVTVGVLTVTNTLAVGGTVSIGGTLTYEDVTNVDAVGLITARNGIVVGSGITLSKDGDGFFTGVTTATTFSGAFSGSTGTFTGNVAVSGANITLQDSGGASDDRLTFGAGTDLSIYHDGSHSRIDELGTGGLIIRSGDIYLRNPSSADMIHAQSGGYVKLYYSGSEKLATTSSGVTLIGGLLLDNASNAGRDVQWQPANDRLVFLDNTKATFGNEIDLSIYHNGSASYIDETGTGALYIRGSDLYLTDEDGTNMLYAANNAGVNLYYGGGIKLATNSDGVSFGDNVKLRLGDAPDYKIYHNGSHTYHENYTGDLYIKSDQMYLMSWTSGEQYLHAVKDGRVALFYDNVIKLQTNGTDGVILANTTDDANYTNALTLTRRGYETSGYGVRIQAKGGSASGQNGLRFKISDGSGSNYTSRFSFTNDGLLFNSDTAAANALDDYEEGTFTPQWNGGSGGVSSITYGTTNGGNYVKIGNLVTVTGKTDITASSGGSGFWYLGNMPFLVYNGGKQYNSVGSVSIENFNMPDTTIQVVSTMEQGNNNMHLHDVRDNQSLGTGISVNNDGAFSVQFAITYRTA